MRVCSSEVRVVGDRWGTGRLPFEHDVEPSCERLSDRGCRAIRSKLPDICATGLFEVGKEKVGVDLKSVEGINSDGPAYAKLDSTVFDCESVRKSVSKIVTEPREVWTQAWIHEILDEISKGSSGAVLSAIERSERFDSVEKHRREKQQE